MKARRANDRGHPSTYQRSFVVSKHALERFRERAETDVAYMNDFDLGNLLDERVKHALAAKDFEQVEDMRNLDVESRVVRIEQRDGSHVFAIMRDLAIVTILEEHMLQKNFDNGSWKRIANKPFKKLTLKDLGAVIDVSAIPVARAPTPEQLDELEEKIEAFVAKPRTGVILDSVESNPTHVAALCLADAMTDFARLNRIRDSFKVELDELTASYQRELAAIKQRIDCSSTDCDIAEHQVKAAEKALADAVQASFKGPTK